MLYRAIVILVFFFFNDTATTEIYTLSLHDALPISAGSTPLRVSGTEKLEYAFFGADLAFSKGTSVGLQRILSATWQFRALGSAGVRGAWLAAGYLDISIGTRNTVWDYAPTALLVSEAGGRATDLSGGPWTTASDGLVATNGRLHAEVLKTLAG